MFLLKLFVSKRLLFATLYALCDTVESQEGDKKDEAADGRGDDRDASRVGQRFPMLLDGVRLVEFFDDGGLTPLYQLSASSVRGIWGMEGRTYSATLMLCHDPLVSPYV